MHKKQQEGKIEIKLNINLLNRLNRSKKLDERFDANSTIPKYESMKAK